MDATSSPAAPASIAESDAEYVFRVPTTPAETALFNRLPDGVYVVRPLERPAVPPEAARLPDRELADLIDRFLARRGPVGPEFVRLRHRAFALAMHLSLTVPPGRVRALALTKLEEAVLWAEASSE